MDWNKYIKQHDKGVCSFEGKRFKVVTISLLDYEKAVADKIAMESKNLEIERLRIQVTTMGKRIEKLNAETSALHKDRQLILQDSDEFMYLMKDLNYIIKEKDNKIKELEGQVSHPCPEYIPRDNDLFERLKEGLIQGGGSCAAPAPGRILPEDPGQDTGGPESKGSRAAESAPFFTCPRCRKEVEMKGKVNETNLHIDCKHCGFVRLYIKQEEKNND